MKVGVFCNKTTKKYLPIQNELFKILNEKNITFSVYEKVEEIFDIDTLIVLGGDGTILKVATEMGKKGIKILGINSGNLGFLTEFEGDETQNAVSLIENGFKTQTRSVLQVEINGKSFYALNEVFFQEHLRNGMTLNLLKERLHRMDVVGHRDLHR